MSVSLLTVNKLHAFLFRANLLIVILLNDIPPSVIPRSVILPDMPFCLVFSLSVIPQSVVHLNVVAPYAQVIPVDLSKRPSNINKDGISDSVKIDPIKHFLAYTCTEIS